MRIAMESGLVLSLEHLQTAAARRSEAYFRRRSNGGKPSRSYVTSWADLVSHIPYPPSAADLPDTRIVPEYP